MEQAAPAVVTMDPPSRTRAADDDAMDPAATDPRAPAPAREHFAERRALGPLARLVEDIASELALEPLLTRVVESACTLIGADDGTIGLYDRERDLIRTAAVYRMPERELGAEMRRGVGLAGLVLADGRARVARYGDLPNITLPELADNSVIGLPIVLDGELLGFFGIGAKPPRVFDAKDLEALDAFGRHAAIAIRNARRYAHERRRTARFELIARIAGSIGAETDIVATLQRAADAIHEVLEFPNVDIPLLDPTDPDVLVVQVRGGSYKRAITGVDRIPVAKGVMGAAVREGRAQLVNDVASDPRYVTPPGVRAPVAELAVPIRTKDEVLGVVNVESDRRFDELDVASLEVVADYLAVAITNARLFTQAREAAVLAERHRLARELHDNVTQVLSSINLLAQTLVTVWRRDADEGARRVARLTELTQTAFAEMRALLHELRPTERETISKTGRSFTGLERLREHALPGALTRLLAAMVPESLELRLDFAGYEPQRIEHEEALFRVCQEAVSNAIRHARARRLYVTAAVDAHHAVLIVGDDGRGIASGRAPGIGMRSMGERVRPLGGELKVGTRPPHGTQVEARLPRDDRTAD